MSLHIIRMPDLGEGVAEVEIVAWHVAPGDAVKEDQALADVMTDKATVEIPSPVVGRVVALGGNVGEVMAVGADLIRIEVDQGGGGEQAVAPPAGEDASSQGSAAAVSAAPEASEQAAPAGQGAAGSARPMARPDGHSLEKPLASPAVRHHARQLDIDLTQVTGSGPGGRILREDLEAFTRQAEPQADVPAAAQVAAGGGGADQAAATAPAAVPATASARPSWETDDDSDDEEAVPLFGLRRRIARTMQQALRIPHFTYVEEVDVTELEALREQLNARHAGPRERLTPLPLLVRALVLALREHPELNARFDDEAGIVTRHRRVHAGIATQTPGGLMVPVLRDAQSLDLWACAREITRLAHAARDGSAQRSELSGSTITISSLGALGGVMATPVINPPEIAIVGVNRIVLRPVIRDGAVVPRNMMNLSSSFDHRVIDGMQAAEFVQSMKRLLECPALLFVEEGRPVREAR